MFRLILPAFFLAFAAAEAASVLTVAELGGAPVSADYSTTKLFVDELSDGAEGARTLIVEFAPDMSNLTEVEVFTNLNRRDRAALDADGDGVHDGIIRPSRALVVAGSDAHYYAAYPMMALGAGVYRTTLEATETGAYRLTARFKTANAVAANDNDPTRWIYYNIDGRREHAVVVSPSTARDIRMYELNVLNIEAEGTLPSQRSTFVDLHDGVGSKPFQAWNLDYVSELGVNWLWFQPIHPYGIDGRHLSAADINARSPGSGATTWRWNLGSPFEDVNYPFELGSPYAVKNFFEVAPQMSKANTRAAAMGEFQDFVSAADARGVSLMLDAAFNHTAWDCEAGAPGVPLGFGPNATAEIRDHEARFYSRADDYDARASSAGNIAAAPDRYDFGKWLDAKDVFFGRYDALVADSGDSGGHLGEGDWIDTSTSTGSFDTTTQNVWRYFAQYVLYWLDQTGHPAGTAAVDHERGIDGLRCDFGQGLPPQAWEYMINVARSRKWSFVFMAESLDGGAVTYRSNRHFDILNENVLFALQGASTVGNYRSIFDDRRAAYGEGLVLLNTVSHDEQNYSDPWQALIRYAVSSTIDGAPMLFSGQEQGISAFFGFDLMEKNFGKYVPHFKTYNSMMPLWSDTDFGNAQLFGVYAGINRARGASPALRSSNRYYLNLLAGGAHGEVWGVAKYETSGASPAFSDVVFAFVNTDRDNDRPGFPGETTVFDVDIDFSGGGNLFGIDAGRTYNVKNVAAFNSLVDGRDEQWLWGGGRSGAEVLANGVLAELNKVPTSDSAWTTDPYEPLFLKLYDVTPPPPPQPRGERHYALGSMASFLLGDTGGDHDHISSYRIDVGTTPGGNDIADDLIVARSGAPTRFDVVGPVGSVVYLTVFARSAAGVESSTAGMTNPNAPNAALADTSVALLDPQSDNDGDGLINLDEDAAGTDPLDDDSRFEMLSAVRDISGAIDLTFTAGAELLYTVQSSADLQVWSNEDEPEAVDHPRMGGLQSFRDLNPQGGRVFYRIQVREP